MKKLKQSQRSTIPSFILHLKIKIMFYYKLLLNYILKSKKTKVNTSKKLIKLILYAKIFYIL